MFFKCQKNHLHPFAPPSSSSCDQIKTFVDGLNLASTPKKDLLFSRFKAGHVMEQARWPEKEASASFPRSHIAVGLHSSPGAPRARGEK